MSSLVVSPDILASAARNLANLGSTISEATTAALPATTSLLPAAADEVSEAIASLFGGHGQAFQALTAKVSQFHDQFVQTLSGGAESYLDAEAANASPLQQLEQSELGFASGLTGREVAFNNALLTNELGLEQRIFGTDSALNGVVNRSFNAVNLLVGTGEQTVNSLLGVQTPAGFTAGLLTGSGAQVFNSGQIGGLEGVFDQSLAGSADFAGLFLGNGSPLTGAVAAVSGSAAHTLAVTSPAGFLAQLQQSELSFSTNLVNGQLSFDHMLLTNELRWEQGTFGTDSALNGVVNRSFNAVNLLVGTGQQTLDSLLGAQVPAGFTANLLTGGPAQTFNGGQIGGLVGVFDQGLAGTTDFFGLLAGDGSAASAASVSPLHALASVAAAPANQVGEFFANVQAGQLNFNTNLVNGELGFNSWVLNHELAFENSFLGADAFNGGENRVFNTENLFIGTGEQLLNSAVGAGWSPQALTASLLTGSSAQVFNGGAIGGIEGIVDQGLAANADLAGLLAGVTAPAQAVFGAASATPAFHALATVAAPVMDPVATFLNNVQTGQLNFNTNLVNGELGFNSWVLNHELAFENSYLGADAFNGGENRVFNTENLFIGTGEELLNSVVGATNWSPQALTASLLTGSSAQVFNGGAIGGLEGIVDQGLAANADLAGLVETLLGQ